MAAYKVEVIRRGIITVNDIDNLEQAEEYIGNCNPVDEVKWSDFWKLCVVRDWRNKMHIETKFNVNARVFCIDKERQIIKKPCNICNGSGTITLKGKIYKCPECHGNDYGKYENVNVFREATINKIKISVCPTNGNPHIAYKCIYDIDAELPLKDKHKERTIAEYENRIFATKEEAEARCKELNGED